MRYNERIFDGSRSMYYADWRLQNLAGYNRWFPGFAPIDMVPLNFMFALLKEFFTHNVCCHVGVLSPHILRVYRHHSEG